MELLLDQTRRAHFLCNLKVKLSLNHVMFYARLSLYNYIKINYSEKSGLQLSSTAAGHKKLLGTYIASLGKQSKGSYVDRICFDSLFSKKLQWYLVICAVCVSNKCTNGRMWDILFYNLQHDYQARYLPQLVSHIWTFIDTDARFVELAFLKQLSQEGLWEFENLWVK